MIEVKTEQPGDYEILQAFPAGLGEQPLPTIIFIMVLPPLSWCTATLPWHWRRQGFA